MEERLQELLEEDEKLLWSGSPVNFATLDKTNKKSIVVGLVIKGIISAAVLIYYFYAARINTVIKPGVVIAILAIAAFAFVNPFLIANRLRKKTIYGFTDRRILRTGANDGSVPYERIKVAALKEDEDGQTTLLCGQDAVKLPAKKWRSYADASFINSPDAEECTRAILYALPVDGKLKAVLKEHLPLN